MEETLQNLYRIRELAMKKEESESNILKLKAQMGNVQSLKELKDEKKKTTLGASRYIIIFAILDVVAGTILDRILTFIIVLTTGYGFTVETALRCALEQETLVFPVRVIIGIPVALLLTLIIKAVIKSKDKKENRKHAIENQNSRMENEQIVQQNVSIKEHNCRIMEQIAVQEQRQRQLVQELKNTASWYPEIYFTLPAVNYVIQQLESGKASSVNQALVHYEAGQI